MRRVRFSIHSHVSHRTRMHVSRKRVHGKETKGRCTCVHVCVCVCITCVKADPECVSRPLQITLAPRKSQLDSFFSFLFPSFASSFFTFSFSDRLIQATTCSNLVIHFSFPDKRFLSILTFDEFRRDIDVANGNRFKQGTRIALFFYIGERKNKMKKGKSFERRTVIESFIWITLGDLLGNFERKLIDKFCC